MVERLNLRELINQLFHNREEDDVLRPCWIRKRCGEANEQCTKYKGDHNLYTDGVWKVK